jgi:hypothetical protein
MNRLIPCNRVDRLASRIPLDDPYVAVRVIGASARQSFATRNISDSLDVYALVSRNLGD